MFKIYDEKESNNIVRVKLIENEKGIELITVDKDGCQDWSILELRHDGKIYLSPGISEDNNEGIQVDNEGCIIIDDIEY